MNKIDNVQPVGKFAHFTDGVWREVTKGSAGVPLYEHPPAADVAELVEALQDLLHQAKLSKEEGGWDFEQAQAALAKWEGK